MKRWTNARLSLRLPARKVGEAFQAYQTPAVLGPETTSRPIAILFPGVRYTLLREQEETLIKDSVPFMRATFSDHVVTETI